MNRRTFLHGGLAAAAAVPFAPIVVGAFGWPTWEREPVPGATVHVLGAPAKDRYSRLVKMLSDDVFDRLCRAVGGRSYAVTQAERIGEVSAARFRSVTMTHQWNTDWRASFGHVAEQPLPFPLLAFRERTNRWMPGFSAFGTDQDDLRKPAREAFGSSSAVGMPFLPRGVLWQAHYLDGRTGMVMRAVGAVDIVKDDIMVRWDVLCG